MCVLALWVHRRVELVELDFEVERVLGLELLPLLRSVSAQLRRARMGNRGVEGGYEVVWVEKLVRVDQMEGLLVRVLV